LVELFSDSLQQVGFCLAAVLLFVVLPELLLRLFKPGDQVWRVEGQLELVVNGGADFVGGAGLRCR
jgi:hypothetical protein